MIVPISIVLILAVVGGPTSRPQKASPTAQEVIRKVAQVYRSARSYEDTGVVADAFNWGLPGPSRKPFQTAFVRPKLFYYQFTEKRPGESERKYVVWADGKKVRSWWTVRAEVEEFDDIGPSLYGPLGVSGGSAHTIPRLLLADTMTTTYAITSITAPKLARSETVRGTPCYRIEGRDIGDTPLTLFIGKSDFLLYRIISERIRGQQKVTEYRPRINLKIDRMRFRFTPPRFLK